MEKEQIIAAFDIACEDDDRIGREYCNETFTSIPVNLLNGKPFGWYVATLGTDKAEKERKKAEAFKKHLEDYRDVGITRVVIEEPLLNSNNIYTVGTLLRYNTMILKSCYEILGLVPTFISTYNARKYAFPSLVGKNDKGKNVLFGGLPKDIDKKHIIWENVNTVCPEVKWLYGKNGQLKKENYDMSDAATAVIGFVNMQNENQKS